MKECHPLSGSQCDKAERKKKKEVEHGQESARMSLNRNTSLD